MTATNLITRNGPGDLMAPDYDLPTYEERVKEALQEVLNEGMATLAEVDVHVDDIQISITNDMQVNELIGDLLKDGCDLLDVATKLQKRAEAIATSHIEIRMPDINQLPARFKTTMDIH